MQTDDTLDAGANRGVWREHVEWLKRAGSTSGDMPCCKSCWTRSSPASASALLSRLAALGRAGAADAIADEAAGEVKVRLVGWAGWGCAAMRLLGLGSVPVVEAAVERAAMHALRWADQCARWWSLRTPSS